jgi:hypothetical protein
MMTFSVVLALALVVVLVTFNRWSQVEDQALLVLQQLKSRL